MKAQSLLAFPDIKKKPLALVVPMPVMELRHNHREKSMKEEVKKEIPQFFEDPIFKAKKYDFL